MMQPRAAEEDARPAGTGGEHVQARVPAMDVVDIMELMPHRYPFLLVDRILELEPGKRAVGLKNVTLNEPFFIGHFPDKPIMPGVLILESMAQVGVIMVRSVPAYADRFAMFAGIEKVRFRKAVLPGDQLLMEVTLMRSRSDVGRVAAVARVGGEVVCEGELTYALVPPGYPYSDGDR